VTPPATTQNPLVYPGAQQVTVQKIYGGFANAQHITYQTRASPEAIGKFYQTELTKDGWEYLADYSSPTYLDYQWVPGSQSNVSTFGLQITMTDTTSITLVELKLSETLPH
jgi:hypothetical protein